MIMDLRVWGMPFLSNLLLLQLLFRLLQEWWWVESVQDCRGRE